jgi:hypothetical protein
VGFEKHAAEHLLVGFRTGFHASGIAKLPMTQGAIFGGICQGIGHGGRKKGELELPLILSQPFETRCEAVLKHARSGRCECVR